MKKCFINRSSFLVLFLILSPVNAYSAIINFAGQLDVIEVESGASSYAGTPIGTNFSGFIDDTTFNGEISNGTTLTSFSCCIDAGGLAISNDVTIDADTASTLNFLTGTSLYNADDKIDIIDIEGDEITTAGGRIEVGLSYIFDASTFEDENLDNYPFDPNEVQLAVFFILEENGDGDDIYSAFGQLNAVPLPASVWLFGTGIIFFTRLMKRKNN